MSTSAPLDKDIIPHFLQFFKYYWRFCDVIERKIAKRQFGHNTLWYTCAPLFDENLKTLYIKNNPCKAGAERHFVSAHNRDNYHLEHGGRSKNERMYSIMKALINLRFPSGKHCTLLKRYLPFPCQIGFDGSYPVCGQYPGSRRWRRRYRWHGWLLRCRIRLHG